VHFIAFNIGLSGGGLHMLDLPIRFSGMGIKNSSALQGQTGIPAHTEVPV
jgi:hypothetical protein